MTQPKRLSNGAAIVALIEDLGGRVDNLTTHVNRISSTITGDIGGSGLSEKLRALELQVIGIDNARKLEALALINAAAIKKEEDRYAEVQEFRKKIIIWLTAVGSVIGAGSGVTTLLTR